MDTEQVGTTCDVSPINREGEEPWIIEHPRFKEMMALDVADSAQVYSAFLVYMDLLEVRNWHEVQIFGSSEFHLVYLRGWEKADCTSQIIIPTPISISYSHERIQEMMKLGRTSEEDQSELCILLAITESDSTVVYYKLTNGFVIPDPPDFVEDLDNKKWRKKKMRLLR